MIGDENESEFDGLVKRYTAIKTFKSENSEEILKKFKGRDEPKFKLTAEEEDSSRPNLSCTAVCADAVCQYTELWKDSKRPDYEPDFRSMKEYYEFIVGRLKEYLKHKTQLKRKKPSDLHSTDEFSLINILSLLKNIQKQVQKEGNNPKADDEKIIIQMIRKLCKEFIINRLAFSSREKPHPFIYYKFLQIIQDWENEIFDDIKVNPKEWKAKARKKKEEWELDYFVEEVTNKGCKAILDYFFERKIYDYGKYEMYRQMTLYNAADCPLFDVKRLIYSLLIVKFRDKYSNNLIKDKVLRLIFEEQLDPNTGLFPIGHVVNTDFVLEGGEITEKTVRVISASPILSSAECLKDMLAHEELKEDLEKYQERLNPTYEWLLKRLRKDSSKKPLPLGWFPEYESVHTPESWVAGHSLVFLKRYCEMLSRLIDKNTREYFQAKEAKDLDKEWDKLCDSYKIKEYLGSEGVPDWHSALIFGPPGSGKSTIAQALAKKLGWKYVELTPAVFLSGGAQNIVSKATEVFNRLVRMKRTVILFDEVDELVKSRSPKKDNEGGEQSVWVVTALLPEFEKLREQHEIKFILNTNHIEEVDSAIMRSGRMDLVRPMGATCWRDRLRMLKEEINAINSQDGKKEINSEIFDAIADKNIGAIKKEEIKNVPSLCNFLERTNNVSIFELKEIIKEIFKDEKNWANIKENEYYKIFFTGIMDEDNRAKIEKFVNLDFKKFHDEDLVEKEIVGLINLTLSNYLYKILLFK